MSYKLSELVELVHALGSWQSENCYVTEACFFKGSLIISNFYTYESKSDKEITHDTIMLVPNKEKTKCKISSIYIGEISQYWIKNYPFIADIEAYKNYIIDIDTQVKEY